MEGLVLLENTNLSSYNTIREGILQILLVKEFFSSNIYKQKPVRSKNKEKQISS